MKEELITKAYEVAKERYAALGVDVEKVMEHSRRWRYPCIVGRPMMLSGLSRVAH